MHIFPSRQQVRQRVGVRATWAEMTMSNQRRDMMRRQLDVARRMHHTLSRNKKKKNANQKRNMANTAGIYHSRLFVFMSPLPGLSPLLNCVLTHFGSIMLSAYSQEGKCDRGCSTRCVCVCVSTLLRDI